MIKLIISIGCLIVGSFCILFHSTDPFSVLIGVLNIAWGMVNIHDLAKD
jgi:hypothetical protein